MILAIDPRFSFTASDHSPRTRLVLIDGVRVVATHDVADRDGVLQAIDALLKKHGGVQALTAVAVVSGDGSFSGVRQAVVLARTLALTQGIPARAFTWAGVEPTPKELARVGKPLTRVAYARAANITTPRRR